MWKCDLLSSDSTWTVDCYRSYTVADGSGNQTAAECCRFISKSGINETTRKHVCLLNSSSRAIAQEIKRRMLYVWFSAFNYREFKCALENESYEWDLLYPDWFDVPPLLYSVFPSDDWTHWCPGQHVQVGPTWASPEAGLSVGLSKLVFGPTCATQKNILGWCKDPKWVYIPPIRAHQGAHQGAHHQPSGLTHAGPPWYQGTELSWPWLGVPDGSNMLAEHV